MTAVEKYAQCAPVKIGYGRDGQVRDLHKSGAERVWTIAEREVFFDKLNVILRPDDVLVLMEPKLLSLDQMKRVAELNVAIQVVGHEPEHCATYEQRRAVRARKPVTDGAAPVETRGRPAKINPTAAQVHSIVALWHSGKKRSAVISEASEIMDCDLKASWVRDLVIKHTGSAARDANAEGKRQIT